MPAPVRRCTIAATPCQGVVANGCGAGAVGVAGRREARVDQRPERERQVPTRIAVAGPRPVAVHERRRRHGDDPGRREPRQDGRIAHGVAQVLDPRAVVGGRVGAVRLLDGVHRELLGDAADGVHPHLHAVLAAGGEHRPERGVGERREPPGTRSGGQLLARPRRLAGAVEEELERADRKPGMAAGERGGDAGVLLDRADGGLVTGGQDRVQNDPARHGVGGCEAAPGVNRRRRRRQLVDRGHAEAGERGQRLRRHRVLQPGGVGGGHREEVEPLLDQAGRLAVGRALHPRPGGLDEAAIDPGRRERGRARGQLVHRTRARPPGGVPPAASSNSRLGRR